MLKLVSLNSNALMLVLLAASLMGAPALAEDTPSTDAKAQEVAEKLMKALGGQANWDKARYLRFDFVVEREGKVASTVKHLWDRYSGRYRVEGTTGEKEAYVVLFEDINARKGKAFRNGKAVQGEDLQKLLDMGYGRFINDTYWLLMPFKWNDPGVHLKYEGTATDKDTVWDKVRLSFEADVGLTPKDRYWAYVNRKTGLMDRWEYILKGGKGPATASAWVGWKEFGGIMLAQEKTFHGRPLRILFQSLKVSAATDEKPFTSLEAHL
jgi:hypothetical protein